MRGFDFRGVTPRDGLRDDGVGGDLMLLAGADWLFVGGITAALGERALTALRAAIAAAKATGRAKSRAPAGKRARREKTF